MTSRKCFLATEYYLKWRQRCQLLGFFSLCSKHSCTKRTKFGQCVLVFRIRDAQKMGREQKGGRKGVGEGKEGNACPQTPRFWKNRSPTNGASDWCGVVILIDKCIKFAWMIPVITRAWLEYVISESFSDAVIIIDRKRRSNRNQQTLMATSLSHFSCPDNERPNLRSRRLVVVFRAKATLLELTIFKQRIPISGWFFNSTVKYFLAAREWSDRQANERSELNHTKSWY